MQLMLADGRSLDFPELKAVDREAPAGFVISIRKSGSTMVTFATQLIAEQTGLPFLDVGSLMFYANVPANLLYSDPALNGLLVGGALFAGFRDYPVVMEQSEIFRAGRKIILLRDPRDALVSEYFSNAYSHDIPSKEGDASGNVALMTKLRQEALGADIDDYVKRRANAFGATAAKFFPALLRGDALVIKYEDIISDKPKLVTQLADRLGVVLSRDTVAEIARKIDIRPKAEDPRAFVRRVTPGDHKEKLKPGTIRFLNEKLSEVLSRFGYETA